jgi:hypothetical protein
VKITRATLENFKCYRGRHELVLGPGVHAVIAELEGDRERSNWLGKTAFLTAVGPFALYGDHAERLEDDWITHDEREGAVEVVLDEHITIRRSRKRGRSTVLEYKGTVGGVLCEAEGPKAQLLIDRDVGMSKADFYSWCFMRQKAMAAFIDSTPGDRQKVVASWLNLKPLEAAGAHAQRIYGSRCVEREQVCNALDRIRARLEEVVKRNDVPEGAELVSFLESVCEQAVTEAERFKEECDQLTVKASKAELIEKDISRQRRELAQWEAKDAAKRAAAKKLEEDRLKDVPIPDKTKAAVSLAAAKAKRTKAQEEIARLQQVAGGKFDGHCPVIDGFECPARQEINSRRSDSAAQLEGARKTFAEVNKEVGACGAAFDEAERMAQEQARLYEAIAKGEVEAAVDIGPRPTVEEPGAYEAVLETTIAQASRRYEEMREKAFVYAADIKLVKELGLERERAEKNFADAQAKVDTWSAATAILGRQGAQRRISEGSLLKIEAAANESLSRAGIDLRVTTSWSRPTKDLADACGACGWAFPRTKSVKRCERCGEERGPKMDERLDLELSNRSGGAEDLAGCAYTFAAGARMRRARHAHWAVGFLDEPFAALDPSHAKKLARYLATEGTFEQLFLVAHSAALMGSMPHRVVVTGTANGSQIRVE